MNLLFTMFTFRAFVEALCKARGVHTGGALPVVDSGYYHVRPVFKRNFICLRRVLDEI